MDCAKFDWWLGSNFSGVSGVGALRGGSAKESALRSMSSKCLLIDNYDSYTYNLYQIVAHVLGEAPDVIFNDGVAWQDLRKRLEAGEYFSIVISPGPGNPNTPSDVGILTDLFQADLGIPILGVCMGMQSLALSYGARVSRAPVPVHGRRSSVEHGGGPLFSGIPSGLGYSVVRYHSLAVEASSLPSTLLPTAWTVPMEGLPSQTRLLMGLQHATRPYWGVQYHPESVESEFGVQLLHNFLSLAAAHAGAAPPRTLAPAECRPPCGRPHAGQARDPPYESDDRALRLAVRHSHPGALERAGGAERLFSALVLGEVAAEPVPTKQDCWWLDSASEDRGRFSFMGGRGGRLWRRMTYRTGVSGGSGVGQVTVESADGATQILDTTFFTWLEATMREIRLCPQALRDSAALEFDFCGGLVGYLGYELRHELGSPVRHPASTPDAALFLADQVVVADRRTGVVSALALFGPGEGHEAEAREWTEAQVARLAGLEASAALGGRSQSRGLQTRPPRPASTWSLASQDEEEAGEPAERRDTAEGRDAAAASAQGRSVPAPANPRPFTLRHDRATYVGNVQRCMEHLYSGDSYELCLTTQLRRPAAFSPWALYRALRRSNAAPFAAFLDFGGAADLQVCCSSPERFLRGSRAGELEAKPIKGTAPRGRNSLEDALAAEALRASEKDRAENLMIVDLMRNDLGRVCEPGSVHVPSLMAIESYATVHQMVSTVRGQRLKSASVADCVAAAFPGGSMTGAPKLRSMEILERLEGGPRGIYAGSVGFFSANDAFDLNIVIRTAVVHQGHVSVGAGGAIVVQSDPEGEFEEMMLKAGTLAKAFQAIDQEGAEQSA